MTETLTINNYSVASSGDNYMGGSVGNGGLMGYVAADDSILYSCADTKIRKFSCQTKTVVATSAAITGAAFGPSAQTRCFLDGTRFVLVDAVHSIFQLWDALTLTLIHDYWSTFSSSILADHGINVIYNQAMDSVWRVEGSSAPYSICHYRLSAGTRTGVSGVTVAAGAQIALDPVAPRLVYADGTNLGTADPSADTATASVAVSGLLTCGRAWDRFGVAPDGFIWATCAGVNNSGHVYKIDPTSLGVIGDCGHHNGFAFVHIDSMGIPVGNTQFTFANIGPDKFVLIGGDGYWELAMVDCEAIAIKWNTETATPLPANGSQVLANNLGTAGLVTGAMGTTFSVGVVTATGVMWSFLNPDGVDPTLWVTRIEVDYVTAVGQYTTIAHAANLNAYNNGGALDPTWPPGNGELVGDLEPLRNWCRANGISIAVNQDSQRTAKDFLDELLTVGNSAPVYSGDQLKIIPYDEVSAAGNGAIYIAQTASGPVLDFDDDDFVKNGDGPFVKINRKRRANCDNVVAIEHIERDLDYSHSVTTECDQTAVTEYGPRKGGALDAADLGVNSPSGSKALLSIHSVEVAQKIASILAKRSASGVNEFSFTLKAECIQVEAMDLITITDSRLGITQVPVRVTSAKETPNRTWDITADQFVYGLNHPDVQGVSTPSGTLVLVSVDPGLANAPIIFQPPPAMLPAGAGPQVWILVSGSDPNYGGCIGFVSLDGGSSYPTAIGNIGPATTGVLTADYPNAADPDTADTLAVDLTESGGEISSNPTAVADGFADPCYVAGSSGSIGVPFEVVCPTNATLTSAEHYSLDTYIRRAVLGTSAMDHPSGMRFAVLDAAVFKIDLPAQWIGKTVYLKFAAYNKIGGQRNDLSACTAYAFTPAAASAPGGFYVNGS